MEPVFYLFYGIDFFLVIIFSIWVISRNYRVPAVTLAWVLAFILLPYLGFVLYLFFGYRRRRREKRRKPSPSQKLSTVAGTDSRAIVESNLDSDVVRVAKLGKNLTHFPVTLGNNPVCIENAASIYIEIAEAINNAKHYVYLEYYVFQPDETGRKFREILISKAQSGVTCRLLVDHIGSFKLNLKFVKPMVDAGVKFAYFWPVKISRPWGAHLRNHRKIVVVDGEIGFVGSQNIGDEYVNWKNRNLSWRDTQLRIEGPAVRQLESIFCEDWQFTTYEKLDVRGNHKGNYLKSGCAVQILPTGPDEPQQTLELIIASLIYVARQRITIVTPYFVPTTTILSAFEAAANTGIDVDILVPNKTNHWIVGWVARGWYRDVINSGAHIFQYSKTFMHAKLVTVDNRVSVVGSANMDERSFRHNFECSTFIYDQKFTEKLVQSFDKMAAESQEITTTDIQKQSLLLDLRDGLFRTLSPLM